MSTFQDLERFVEDFFEFYNSNTEEFRHGQYDVYSWNEDMSYTKQTVHFPYIRDWLTENGEKIGQRELIDDIVESEETAFVGHEIVACNYLDHLIKRIIIEDARTGEASIEKLSKDLLERLRSSKYTVSAISIIQGLEFDTEWALSDKARIEKISDYERELLVNRSSLRGSKSLERYLMGNKDVYALKLEEEKELEESGKDKVVELGVTDANSIKDRLDLALRLHKEMRFSMEITDNFESLNLGKASSRSKDSNSPNGGMSVLGQEMKLSEEELEGIDETYNMLSHNLEEEDEGLRIAIDRFKSSYRKLNNSDNLVDCMIGIEALMSKQQSDRFYHNKRRAACILEDPQIESDLQKFWGMRGAIVHGAEKKVHRDDIKDVREILRRLILRVYEIGVEREISSSKIAKRIDEEIATSSNPF